MAAEAYSQPENDIESKITLDKVPLFQSRVRPKPYVEPQKPKKPNLIQRMIRAVIGD
jgi:hypothetical protein